MILDINIFQATAKTSQLNYITSKTMELAVGDSSHDYWECDNLTFMSWIINSREDHNSHVLMLLMTAKDIQENQHTPKSP